MDSDFIGPVNVGSEEMVTINQLVDIAASIDEKDLEKSAKRENWNKSSRNTIRAFAEMWNALAEYDR